MARASSSARIRERVRAKATAKTKVRKTIWAKVRTRAGQAAEEAAARATEEQG